MHEKEDSACKRLGQRLKVRAQRLKIEIPAVFFAIHAAGTPWYAKALGWITVAYALSPVDLIPDFVPVLGFLDDLLLLPLMVTATIKLIPPDVMDACRIRAGKQWENGKPKRWYYALPVIAVWGLIVAMVLRAICYGN